MRKALALPVLVLAVAAAPIVGGCSGDSSPAKSSAVGPVPLAHRLRRQRRLHAAGVAAGRRRQSEPDRRGHAHRRRRRHRPDVSQPAVHRATGQHVRDIRHHGRARHLRRPREGTSTGGCTQRCTRAGRRRSTNSLAPTRIRGSSRCSTTSPTGARPPVSASTAQPPSRPVRRCTRRTPTASGCRAPATPRCMACTPIRTS